MTVPERGDLVILDFDPQVGREQMKRRPALVLSPAAFNRSFGLAYVAPITTKPRGHAFEVPLPDGLPVNGSVLAHQLKSVDWRGRNATHVAKAPKLVVSIVADIVKKIVG